MPAIPQISNPISNKSFSQNNLASKQSGVGGEQFDIIRLMNPLETVSVSDREAGRHSALLEQKDFLPMMVKLTKDPTMAVESLKQLINSDLLAIAKANGYTELHGELESLMKSLFLSPDNLLSEILAQEKSTTMFGGDAFFDLLRQLMGMAEGKANAEDLKNAIGNMLKAINYSRNQQEILNALSSNMKFLAQYFSPNKGLAEDLSALAERWGAADAAENFQLLKDETLFLIRNVTDSLLNNERIQVLVPLIVHNLSRYNINSAVLNEYFAQLLTQVPGHRMREELTDAFAKLAEGLFGGAGVQEAYLAMQDAQKPAIPDGGFARLLGEMLMDETHLAGMNLDEEMFSAAVRSFLLGKESGVDTIKNLLMLLGSFELKGLLDAEMSEIDDISKLVSYLNDILRNMPDISERQMFYEHMTEIINAMVENEELPLGAESRAEQQAQTPPPEAKESTLKQLIQFIEKNIDHAAIKTINNYNASNLLQSLINAPGVFTPLAHYIIPLDVGGIRSFGELWVDPDSGNAAARERGGKQKYHLFLTFEVEAAGRFEVDLYADGQDVNLSFFYPESFAEKAAPMLGRVGKIIAQSGYNTREIRTGPLIKPHDLTQVFPDINERRTGFNVKA